MTVEASFLTIPKQFRGPDDSANGGYVCGAVASRFGDVEVTLRQPPPLDRRLRLAPDGRGGGALFDGEALLAEAAPSRLDPEVPDRVSLDEAARGAEACPHSGDHPLPRCFVCGPERGEGDGLRIFPGPVPERDVVAAPWTPHRAFADASGHVAPEIVWASLDCPGAFAVKEPFEGLALLGRLAVRILVPVRPEEPHAVVGWQTGADGRKLYAGTAVFAADGTLCAFGRATWILVQQ